MTYWGPTAALVSGGKQPQFEPLKSMPSKLCPTAIVPPDLSAPSDSVGAVQVLGLVDGVVRLDVEIGAASDRQAVLHARIASDLDVVCASGRGDKVLDVLGDVGRTAHAGRQHVAAAVHQRDLEALAVEALGDDGRRLAGRQVELVEVLRVLRRRVGVIDAPDG